MVELIDELIQLYFNELNKVINDFDKSFIHEQFHFMSYHILGSAYRSYGKLSTTFVGHLQVMEFHLEK